MELDDVHSLIHSNINSVACTCFRLEQQTVKPNSSCTHSEHKQKSMEINHEVETEIGIRMK